MNYHKAQRSNRRIGGFSKYRVVQDKRTPEQKAKLKAAKKKATWKQRQLLHWQLDLTPTDTQTLTKSEASELIGILKPQKRCTMA